MKIIHFETIDSTNTYLKNHYQELEDLTFVSADYQSNGKGRNNRNWISDKGANIMFSLLIKDPLLINRYQILSVISAYTVLEVLKDCGLNNLGIKWPNDVYVNDKKICGILLEGVSEEILKCLIIGIGLNVNQEEFIGNYLHEPTSVYKELGQKTDIDLLRNNLYERLIINLDKVKNEYDFYSEIKEYDYLKNRRASAFIHNEVKNVTVEGINEDYSLAISYENKRININAGEISFHL